MGAIAPLDAQIALDGLGQPAVMHFCGQMGTEDGGIGSFGRGDVALIRRRVDRALRAEPVGVAYGGLASGGDLVFAEAVLEAGIELQVVLPFPVDEFKRVSVSRFGADWGPRFDAALAAATHTVIASDSEYGGNDRSFDFGTKLAMGLALQRARHLVTPVLQMAIHDGHVQAPRPVGTEANLRFWRGLGLRSIVFDATRDVHDAPPQRSPNNVLPIVLMRLNGFQMLRGAELPPFLDDVLGRVGLLLDDTRHCITWRAMWGDGAVTTLEHVAEAAELVLRDGFGSVRLRLGLHSGQLADVPDPVLASAPMFGVLAEQTPPLTSGVYASAAFIKRLGAVPGFQSVAIPAVADRVCILRRTKPEP